MPNICRLVFLLTALISTLASSQASELNNKFLDRNSPKIYSWKVIRVVDGDTLEIANDFLPKELKLFVRVSGIDTPEKDSRAKCQKEKILARKATEYTSQIIYLAQRNNKPITFSEIKWDKYGGRILAVVKVADVNLGNELIKKGLAREYFGDKKKSWCTSS